MKGVIRIGVAGVAGILIILGAFYVSAKYVAPPEGAQGAAVAQKQADRLEIEAKDSDRDGTPDWEEALQAKTFERIATPTSTITSESGKTYVPPTTLTGKFSEAFLQDYLEGKIEGADFSDPTAFVNSAVEALETNTQSKKHTRAELTIISATEENVRAYGNEIVDIINRHSKSTESELAILSDAVETNSEERLADLKEIQTAYEKVIADTLLISVPDAVALLHIDLLNVYESLVLDISAMQLAFSDPLYALARVRVYEDDTQTLANALRNIATVLNTYGITYKNDEPGSFFYIFDAI